MKYVNAMMNAAVLGLFITAGIAIIPSCKPLTPQQATDVKVGISATEQACADAIALTVPDATIICTGIALTGDLINAIFESKQVPAAAMVRMAEYRKIKGFVDAGQ